MSDTDATIDIGTAEGEDTGAEQTRRPHTLGQVAAEILWLMTRTASHRHFFIADAEWLIFPPIANAQFRIYRDNNQSPAGCVLWADPFRRGSAARRSRRNPPGPRRLEERRQPVDYRRDRAERKGGRHGRGYAQHGL